MIISYIADIMAVDNRLSKKFVTPHRHPNSALPFHHAKLHV